MAKQKAAAVLNRLAGKRIVFNGKFEWGQRERLEPLARAHGATILEDLDATVDYLILPDPAAGKTIQAKAQKLNARGAAIQTMDVDTFENAYEPTEPELLELIRGGPDGAEVLKNACLQRRAYHGSTPPKTIIRNENFDGIDLSGFILTNLRFEDCSFVGAKMERTLLADAVRCDFTRATGSRLNFDNVTGSRFTGAKLPNTTIHGDFENLDLTSAEMPELVFWGKSFVNNIRQRKSKGISGVIFKNGKFRAASIQPDGRLIAPDFEGADLSDTAMSSTQIDSGNFRNAILKKTELADANLPNADFTGANLTDADLGSADLTGAKFDDADLTRCNMRDAKLDRVDLSKARNYKPAAAVAGLVGPSLTELDNLVANSRRIQIEFKVRREADDGEGEAVGIDTARMKYGWGLTVPHEFHTRAHGPHVGTTTCSGCMMELTRMLGHWKVRYETLDVTSTKASLSGKPLRELVMKGIAEAFAQPIPNDAELATATKAYREKQKEGTSVRREERDKAKQEAEKQKEKAKKQIAKKIEKQVGKVTDTATFLKALELRIEPEKIKKATKMLKASRFQLYNDVTDAHTSGVVKSQTDADLVYACRINEDGSHSCCTQNLNVCGGLRGSICKHLLVLIIGLVNANQLDAVTIDQWVAKSQNAKPVLDKEKMGEIFIRYKGAEAGEVDWRPTETLPEDYYAL